MEDITDPELKVLAESLPTTVLQSRAPATAKKYAGAFSRWKKWAVTKPEVIIFPAKPVHVAFYLSFFLQKSQTAAPIEEAVNALAWSHTLACVEDPTKQRRKADVGAQSNQEGANYTTDIKTVS